VDVCVVIQSDEESAPGLKKLVLSEIARHRSHRVVEERCETTLTVEWFGVGKAKQYLTARIGKEIPARFEVPDLDALDEILEEALKLVLGNDPARLSKNIDELSRMQRATHSVLQKGHTIWRAEIFETLARGEGGPVFASGAAFAASRGADHLRVVARIYFAGWPGTVGVGESALRISAGMDLGMTYEVSRLARTSFYMTGGLGIQYLRYEGRMRADGRVNEEHIDEIIPAPLLRVGVRFLRYCDFDLDLFATFYLPLFKVNDEDSPLFGRKGIYTPSAQIGMGVGF
jgi:hypothetical protein